MICIKEAIAELVHVRRIGESEKDGNQVKEWIAKENRFDVRSKVTIARFADYARW